jgi:VanZ family protein
MRDFWRYYFPAILYACLIFLISSIPDLGLPQIGILGLDKLAHFLEYALFGWLIVRSLGKLLGRFNKGRVYLLSFLLVTVFACLDEWYQMTVPGRESDIIDVLFDIAGALVAIGIMAVRQNKSGQENAQVS